MAYNVLKGKVEGSVDQHADQEIAGVKVFKNTVSASVFWDTDAQSPCATMKDVAVTDIKGRHMGGVLTYNSENTLQTNYNFTYKDETLSVQNLNASNIAGSAKRLYDLPADRFNNKISAGFLNYSQGLQDVRGSLQIKTSEGIFVSEDGVGLNIDSESGLWLKRGYLTIDPTKAERINIRGQNLSDDDLLIVSDVSTGRTNNTTLKNLYDNYIEFKIPQSSGAIGSIQLKGKSGFDSSAKLSYDTDNNVLKIENKIKAKEAIIDKSLTCAGAVYHNITKTSCAVYQVTENDYTILCDSSNNKVLVELPPPCNNVGRVLVIKKANSDRYKLNSNAVEIQCQESKIDINDSINLKSNYSTRTLQSDGETWHVINKIG